MSTCPPADTLSRLIAGEVADVELESLEDHLQSCASCRDLLDEMTSAAGVSPLLDPENSDRRVGRSNQPKTKLSDDSDSLLASVEAVVQRLKESGPNGEQPTHAHRSSDTSEEDTLEATATFGAMSEILNYRILQEVGSGVSGQLFRAYDTQLGRDVALKVLHPSLVKKSAARQRLQREAKAMAALNHENIVTLHDFVTLPDMPPFLVLEFVDGGSLEKKIQDNGPMHPRIAAKLVASVASALHAAHEAGVIHRDVKSSNILLDHRLNPRVTDFGLARSLDSDSRLTKEGMIAGTPAYMSPEQITDPSDVDAISDTYSLGVVLYEALTGVLPFRGTSRMTLSQVLQNDPLPLRQLNDRIPIDLETICLKAMAKDPASRYPSSLALQEDLERFIDNRPVLARRVGWLPKTIKWCQRNPSVAALWSAVAATFILATAISLTAAVRLSMANHRVRQSENDARQSMIVAGRQRDASLQTLRRLLVDVPRTARQTEDITEIEKLVSQIALDGLSQVAESAEDSQVLDLHTARGHFQLGATYWWVDELEKSQQHLESALRILQNSEADSGNSIERNLLLAETHLYLGYLLEQLQIPEDAVNHVHTAFDFCDLAIAEQPTHYRAGILKAKSLTWLAEQDNLQRRSEDGLQLAQQAELLLEDLAVNHPDSAELDWEIQDNEDLIAELQASAELQRMSQRALESELSEMLSDADQASADDSDHRIYDSLSRAHELASELTARGEGMSERNYREITLRLADAARFLGYPDEALMHYESLLESGTDVSSVSDAPEDLEDSEDLTLRIGAAVSRNIAEMIEGDDPRIRALVREVSNISQRTARQRLDLIDLLILQSYNADLSPRALEKIAKRVRNEFALLVAMPEFKRLSHWRGWKEQIEEELESLQSS